MQHFQVIKIQSVHKMNQLIFTKYEKS